MKLPTPRRIVLVLSLAVIGLSCFPELPNPNYIDNLRVVAIQADPATAMLDEWPPPKITVTALVVDPRDDALAGATHEWSLDLPEDIEGVEWLQSLIPPPPHTNVLVIDLANMGAPVADVEYITAILPLRYRVERDGEERKAVKLVSFLMPDFGAGEGDDDGRGGGDDDSAGDDDTGDDDVADDDVADDDSAGDDDVADDDSAGDDDHPLGYNENPVIVSLTFDQERVFTAADGQLPGIAAPLLTGPIASDEWLRIGVEVDDDKDPGNVWADLYWTAGCPGAPLPDEGPGGMPMGEIGDNLPVDECPASDWEDGYGGSAALRKENDVFAEFGWYPLSDIGGVTIRLFLVLRDEEGGQTWQEIRPE